MALTAISTGLPADVTSQLMASEKVYYFSFIAFKGGCGSKGQKENYCLPESFISILGHGHLCFSTHFSKMASQPNS